jgi:hypothetical protein
VGWYSYSVAAAGTSGTFTGSITASITFNLGDTIQEQATEASTYGATAYSNSTTYTQAHLNSTGALYQTMQYVVLGGILVSLGAGVLAVLPGSRPGVRRGALALGIVALLLAIAAPTTLAVAQPGAIQHDHPFGNSTRNMTGPWTSYFGSCASGANCGTFGNSSGSAGTYTESWGPGGGWYLSVTAFVFLLVGVLLARRPSGSAAPAMPPSSIPYYAPQQPGYGMPPPGYGAPPSPYPPGPATPPPAPPPAGGWPPPPPGPR